MKAFCIICLITTAFFPDFFQPESDALDVNVLVGEWKLDMSPKDTSDNNFAMMKINSVGDNRIEGDFYRTGVQIKNGRINTQSGLIYGALISGDNSGSYNTAFYYVDGVLYGSTHAVDRDFLAVWTAIKVD